MSTAALPAAFSELELPMIDTDFASNLPLRQKGRN